MALPSIVALCLSIFNISEKEEGKATHPNSQTFSKIAVLPDLSATGTCYNEQVSKKRLLSPAAGARVADDSLGKPFAFPQQAAVMSPQTE